MSRKSKKLWGGGYKKKTSDVVEKFTESISFDKRLAPFDILGSIAHAEMLGKQKIISTVDSKKIVKGLKNIAADIEAGKFQWDESLEDVHMNIEAELTRRIGDAGARVHTGRSRNDQVATAFRLYCADAAKRMLDASCEFMAVLKTAMKRDGHYLLPGYTHMQQAQPVLWRTHLGAYAEIDLMACVQARHMAVAKCPLGAAALAGSTLPLDREYTAKKLGFVDIAENTMDAVSSRDFALYLLFACSMIQLHLSRLAEDLIIFSSKEFGFVTLDDSVTTGSSLMPQKKNPDVCELTRGKTGRVVGNLMSLLMTIKGLPMTYNRDLQEDKEPVFDSVDTVMMSLEAMSLVVETMTFNAERARAAIDRSTLATDLAEQLVEKGMPFRHAHEKVARMVHSGEELLADLTPERAVRRRKL